ncbi:MAG: hypothetical protein D6744_13140 [Planctomycetota bacterium]|nr:MAG: hypothetical protein D6744_13140 [Planctomycetota bacterium]
MTQAITKFGQQIRVRLENLIDRTLFAGDPPIDAVVEHTLQPDLAIDAVGRPLIRSHVPPLSSLRRTERDSRTLPSRRTAYW